MGADGHIIMVKIEDIENIINRFFLEAYIRKNFKEVYDIVQRHYTYENINKEDNKQLIYSVIYNKHIQDNIPNEIIIDLTDYKEFIEVLRHEIFENCTRYIPEKVIEYHKEDLDYFLIKSIEEDPYNLTYYWDNCEFEKYHEDTMINYLEDNDNDKTLKNFMNTHYKVYITDNNIFLRLFNNLFDDIEDFIKFFNKIIIENRIRIYEEQIWT